MNTTTKPTALVTGGSRESVLPRRGHWQLAATA